MPDSAADSTLLHLLFEATNDGVIDWNLLAGTATYNERWRYLLALDQEELATTPETWRELVHPQDRPSLEENLIDHLDQGWPFIQTVRMRHAAVGWRWILIRGATQRDAANRPIRMVIIFADIDERVRADRQIQAMVEAMPDTMFRIQADGTIVSIKHGNTALQPEEQNRLFGFLQEADVGARLAAIIQSPQKLHHVEIIPARFKNSAGEPTFHEIRVIRSSDDESVCIVRDITHEKKIEAELARSKELESIGRLASGLAHEINTPLQYIGDNLHFAKDVIPGLLDLVLRYRAIGARGTLLSEAERRELDAVAAELDLDFLVDSLGGVLRNSFEGLEEIAKIVHAMRMFEDVERRQRGLLDLNAIVENAVVISTHIWSGVAKLTLLPMQGLPMVPGCAGEIAQAIIQLLTNAAQAIEAKLVIGKTCGQITVTTGLAPTGEHAFVRVVDDGEGIRDEIRDKIFEPFFTTRPVGKGRGQGLAQVQSVIAGMHGGSIDFDSEVGVGSTFTLRLPLVFPAPTPQVKAPGGSVDTTTGNDPIGTGEGG